MLHPLPFYNLLTVRITPKYLIISNPLMYTSEDRRDAAERRRRLKNEILTQRRPAALETKPNLRADSHQSVTDNLTKDVELKKNHKDFPLT